jgi:hypothetical protein
MVLKQPSPSKTSSEDLSLMNLSLSSLLSEPFAEFAVNGDSGKKVKVTTYNSR